jgi:hypothetical protein
MSLFFFNVHDGVALIDEEGTELPDITAAKLMAVKLAGAMLQDDAEEFWNGEQWQLDVTDATGLTLFSLTFIGTDAPSIGSERMAA